MPQNIIFVLMYQRHKLLDLTQNLHLLFLLIFPVLSCKCIWYERDFAFLQVPLRLPFSEVVKKNILANFPYFEKVNICFLNTMLSVCLSPTPQ
jgi:hypothetical protein